MCYACRGCNKIHSNYKPALIQYIKITNLPEVDLVMKYILYINQEFNIF